MVTRRIRGSPVKVTGAVPTGVEFESHLEEDFLTLLRFDHRVSHYARWQEEIAWYDDRGKRRTYTPDFFVEYKSLSTEVVVPSEVIEVKPDFAEDDPRSVARLPRREDPRENELKWKAAAKECGRRGFRFLVKRESEIRTPYLTNARFLMAYLERRQGSAQDRAIVAALEPGVRITLCELLARLGASTDERLRYRPSVYRLLATRELDADLTELLRDTSLVGLKS